MRKLLIIEDDTVLRENTAELLHLAGYEPLTAPNGKLGIKIAKEHLPDLIICDIMMPELDGYGVLENMSQDKATRQIPLSFYPQKRSKKIYEKAWS
ncbi:response regulator [Maribacter halichondriae]|uniref:response regulator n=1 Tax=Maribacter halichondriae TaxID=2980554 RepID=UPI003075FF15